jgi:lipoprotein-anchoring transpeptidase ErfK/SrfK
MKSRFLCLQAVSLFVSFAPLLNPDQGMAQSPRARYTPPQAVVLSPDISGPWILQLKRNPVDARGRVAVIAPSATRPPVRRAQPIMPGSWARPRQAPTAAGNGITPLVNDPIRGNIKPQAPQFARVQEPQREPSRPKDEFDPKFEPQIVNYDGEKAPGTIIIDTEARFLYLVEKDGMARRYGVGVGKPGFEWAGTHKVTRKAEWPSWNPPEQMIARERIKGRILPAHMEGGPENPLGARALYLGSTLYRIHGTNQPWTIGRAVSSGCIRMRNEDVMDLYERVKVGTKVIVS